jgi:hypothetical protein
MPDLKQATLTFVEPSKERYTRPLEDLASYPFESALPVRKFPSHPEQRNLHAIGYFSKTDTMVVCESLLERDALTLFEFDAEVQAVSAQPFRLRAKVGRSWKAHTPDFFLRLTSGRCRVVDVCLATRLGRPSRAEKHALMESACKAVGWDYCVQSELPPAYRNNLHALAGFRRKPGRLDELAPLVLEAASQPRTIEQLETLDHPALVRPVVFHLIWRGDLRADLTAPLRQTTRVRATSGKSHGEAR